MDTVLAMPSRRPEIVRRMSYHSAMVENMMRTSKSGGQNLPFALSALLLLASAGSASGGGKAEAVPAGDTPGIFRFGDTGEMGNVLFDHFAHQERMPDCRNCHEEVFPMERGRSDREGKLNTASMLRGEYCGRCHNGKIAFPVEGDCSACHLPARAK